MKVALKQGFSLHSLNVDYSSDYDYQYHYCIIYKVK